MLNAHRYTCLSMLWKQFWSLSEVVRPVIRIDFNYISVPHLYICSLPHIIFLIQDMQKDFATRGYVVEWDKLDAQWFLLRQRRNRVWATCDVNAGQCADEYAKNMKSTVRSMASDVLFPLESCFDTTIEADQLSRAHLGKVKSAMEKDQLDHSSGQVFVDPATSSNRSTESACNVCTCIRPSHNIYSVSMKRWVRVNELWNCQGLWRNDFPNPSAVDDMLQWEKEARDLVGKVFQTQCSGFMHFLNR